MKKVLLPLIVGILVFGNAVCVDSTPESVVSTELVDVVSHALSEAQVHRTNNGESPGHVVWYIHTEEMLAMVAWGAQFIEDYTQEFMHLMSLGMLDDQDPRKEKLIQESRHRIMILQRFLRDELEPYIKQYAIDNGIDIIVDSYTGSLLYVVEHLSLEGITIQA